MNYFRMSIFIVLSMVSPWTHALGEKLIVVPSTVTIEQWGRTLVTVTVEDSEGQRVPHAPVDFLSSSPGDAFFPRPRAFTNSNGVAHNVITIGPSFEGFEGSEISLRELEASFTVSSGMAVAGPFPVQGEDIHGDGLVQFSAAPLRPFVTVGSEQRLTGTACGPFREEIGRTISAWSVDPTVAEISPGRIVRQIEDECTYEIEFPVKAHKEGRAFFILGTADLSLYEATVTFTPFLRGDCDGDGRVGGSPTEAIILLTWAFRGGEEPPCLAACDTNADGKAAGSPTDAVAILKFAFGGGNPPPPPFPNCGTSVLETDAMLGCLTPPADCE